MSLAMFLLSLLGIISRELKLSRVLPLRSQGPLEKSKLLHFLWVGNKGFFLGGDISSGGADGMGHFRWIGRDVPRPLRFPRVQQQWHCGHKAKSYQEIVVITV